MPPPPPLIHALLHAVAEQLGGDLGRIADCAPPPASARAGALRQLHAVVKTRVRRDAASVTAERSAQVSIAPECSDASCATDRDVGGAQAQVRALSGQVTLGARETREAVLTQQKEHRTYRQALSRILDSVKTLRSQNAELAGDTEVAWRLAQSRGLLKGEAALPVGTAAWTEPLGMPLGFGKVRQKPSLLLPRPLSLPDPSRRRRSARRRTTADERRSG